MTSPAESTVARQPGAAAAPAGQTLTALLDGGATYPAISAHLDALSAADRLEQMLAVTGSRVGKLYAAVADGPAIVIDDFFPPETPDGVTIIYEGRNSLAMFTRFQKRFCRKDGVIVGYNHQSMSAFTGPGYFVLSPGDAEHPREILFDYTATPPHFPEGWPAYRPNSQLLSRAVYHNMKDYCRRVAQGVVVGAAFRLGEARDAYFSLTRA
jgi:hypothetical protein